MRTTRYNGARHLTIGLLAALSALVAAPDASSAPANVVAIESAARTNAQSAAEPRPPGTWPLDGGMTLFVVGIVVAAQGGLILALLSAAHRRREARRLLASRLRFEQLLTELSLSIATVDPREIDAALDATLGRVAACLGIDAIWRWDADSAQDAEWDSPSLRAGEPARFGDPAELPPGIRQKLGEAGVATCSVLAVPLIFGGLISGALFCVRREPLASFSAHDQELRALAAVVATILLRKHAEIVLEGRDRLKRAILDSLPAHIAVLDPDGVIIDVNHPGSEIGRSNHLAADQVMGPGTNYVRACLEGARAGADGASDAAAMIEQACRGERSERQVEYRGDSPDPPRWFRMTAEPLHGPEVGAVVTHWEITSREYNEIALRESEDRFRSMAEALPVAVWVSDADGARNYFNKEWLKLTGRTLEQECGDGWLESVHADDRAACLVTYRRALRLREAFRMEYRIRRHDGEYRWLLDTGTRRYGATGEFQGYGGSCVDITERKEAERMLRTLSHRLMQAQDDERRRIARELHDHLSQQLALLSIDLQQLAMNASAEAFVTTIQDAWRRTAEIAGDVHAMSHRLHPSKMEALGLVATVKAHCLDASRQSLTVHFHHHKVPVGLSPDRALSIFRVLEEALSNVSRHSEATEARVSLTGDGSHVTLQVTDNGQGFDTTTRRVGGLGLISMRERLQALGGTLAITSVPGNGTVVEARVPRAGKQYGRRLADVVRPAPLRIREDAPTAAIRRRAKSA